MNIRFNESAFWLSNLAIILYFTLKDKIFSKLFGEKSVKTPPLLAILLTMAALVINSQLTGNYERYLSMSYVKGAIYLPPFTFLFLMADFISSILLTLLLLAKKAPMARKNPGIQTVFDVLRLIFIWAIFQSLVSSFWFKEESKLLNFDYLCFSDQVTVDMAGYYFRNNRLPEKLSDFTNYKVNPINNSKLVLTLGDVLSVKVSDEKGNIVMEGSKQLIGIKMYETNPSEFFKRYNLKNSTICKDKLNIPELK